MSETGYEMMKRIRAEKLETSICELERLAEAHKDTAHFLSEESFKLGLQFAIREIEGTEMLMIKAHTELPYSNPKEAEREHKNLMNILGGIKYRLKKRYEGQP